MPEGPSIVILKEEVNHFAKKKVIKANGAANIDFKKIEGKTITRFKTHGKHLLICFKDVTISIHLLMFGTYLINEKKKLKPRLHMQFAKGELNFYTCNVKMHEGDIDEIYDPAIDIMNKHWDIKQARKSVKEKEGSMICDVLLDQNIFAGSGNIIKNEVLFRQRIHPESIIENIPPRKLTGIINETVKYSADFLKWKKAGTLKKNWEIYTRKKCPRCNIPSIKEYTGKTKRRTFYCETCQVLY